MLCCWFLVSVGEGEAKHEGIFPWLLGKEQVGLYEEF